ncbi:IS4 family transposase [Amycolatopsis sacchari]
MGGSVAAGTRLPDRISLGVLADVVPRDLIEDVLTETGARESRVRRLPAHVMVRFCQAMCLFYDDDYEEVMRKLVGALQSMRSWSDDWQVPTTSAITQARQRLGSEPLRELFYRVAVPVAGHGTKGAWLGSRRLMAIDGFVVDVPDTPDNAEQFGKSHSDSPYSSAFPQVRVVGLGECGTHALVDAAMDGIGTDEKKLAQQLLDSLAEDMLVTADRYFYSYPLWRDAAATGADLLWRVQSTIPLPALQTLPDGSYLSLVFHPRLAKHHRQALIENGPSGAIHPTQATLVRALEYDIPNRDANTRNDTIRLITTILDPEDTTAIELATAYHQRWEQEGLIAEIKTRQRGPGRILRSRSPEMVRQEIWALLLTHYSIRHLMTRAADQADLDPDQLSFTRSLRIIRRQVTNQADFSPSTPPRRTS